ncbi:MAG: hypothetical protein AAGK04_13100, partial [Planctomycetota bacterium]
MTREHKLGLILGFSVLLGIAVLISDQFSDAQSARLADGRVSRVAPSVGEAGGSSASRALCASENWSLIRTA